jgi:hypothetical protein
MDAEANKWICSMKTTLDNSGGSITIQSITDRVVRRGSHKPSPNLLPAPVTLDSYLLFDARFTLKMTTSYVVQAGDPDYIADYADVAGTINFNGTSGSNVPADF